MSDLARSDDRAEKGTSEESVEYRIKIREVKERKLPELNEEFAKRFTGWTGRPDPQNIAELKSNIEADLDIKARKEAEQILRRNLVRKVVEANPNFLLVISYNPG